MLSKETKSLWEVVMKRSKLFTIAGSVCLMVVIATSMQPLHQVG